MTMTFIKAKQLFDEGKYNEALEAYQKLAKQYGKEVVEYNIIQCKKNISNSPVKLSEKNNSAEKNTVFNYSTTVQHEYFDAATRIMLHNKGDEVLSDTEYKKLLTEYRKLSARKSEDVEVKTVKQIPNDWPKDLQLVPLPEGPNDYRWYETYRYKKQQNNHDANKIGLSVIIPTFNRSWILDITLACLVNQKTHYPFEVIVADDGSKEQIVDVVRTYEDKLDIKYVRQKDYGYQLCAVRNLGLRTAKYDFVSILDCDMAPNPFWVDAYTTRLLENDDIALIGPRKYVDTHGYTSEQFLENNQLIESLPEVRTNNNTAGKTDGEISVDWRLDHFRKTENLRLCDSPFRYFSGGNVAFAKKWLTIVGNFDEEFTHWGGEDNEFGYRLFKYGCYFQSLDGGMAYHQEPPGKENETDRAEGKKITIEIVREKVPYYYRKLESIETAIIHKKPLVSIYIPAYNCADSIIRCVDSALNQTVTDLEVCICNDGSTDNTLAILEQHYGHHPRVRITSKENGGIASASNVAIKMAQGYYIGQLDSDDYLDPDAVELCLKEFLKNRELACVYTTNRNVNPDGSLIASGYNWPEFSREKFTTAMIVHHFRMFTARAWYLSGGFDEHIENSVDYDIYLKLSEIGKFKHINKICYNRVLHGENTSIKKLDIQKNNHFKVVNNSLKRQGIDFYRCEPQDDDKHSRKYRFEFDASKDVLPTKSVMQMSKKFRIRLAFNIVCNDELKNLNQKIRNFIEYNQNVSVIIIHVNKKFITKNIKIEAEQLSKQYKIAIILNHEIEDNKQFKFKQVGCYSNNYHRLAQEKLEYDYMVFDNYDSMFVQPDLDQYIAKFDIGINLGKVTGYWREKILAHQVLHTFVQKHLPSHQLEQLDAKGSCQGMFIKKSLLQDIFSLIEELQQECSNLHQPACYHAEEIWFQVAYLVLKQYKSLHCTHTITYLPWDRKLQWTEQQIEEAKQGIGLPDKRFCINQIHF